MRGGGGHPAVSGPCPARRGCSVQGLAQQVLAAGRIQFARGKIKSGPPMGESLVGNKGHIGEVQASIWDEETIHICAEAGVILL